MEIEDAGIGIEKKDLEKIFNPFQQSKNVSIQKGTGLGLTISKQYAELLDGSISVESEVGVGTKFTLKIPLIANDKTFAEDENKYKSVDGIVSGQTDFRILIVEDQEENWLLLKRIHEKIGIEVEIAKNGLQGFEMFEKW